MKQVNLLLILCSKATGSKSVKLEVTVPENTDHKGKYHCTADLLFDWFGFDHASKTVVHSTQAKQLNPLSQCSLAVH